MNEPQPRSVPPCEVTGPAGEHLLVRPAGPDDVVDDLRAALGLPGDRLMIDGAPTDPATLLTESGLLHGSVVEPEAAAPMPPMPPDPGAGYEWAVVAGPACTPWRSLAFGCHRIGRAPEAELRVADPAVEAHHGVLTVGDAVVGFTQLTGRTPARVGDRTVGSGSISLAPGEMLRLGSSHVAIRPAPTTGTTTAVSREARAATDPWRRVVVRGRDAPVDRPAAPTLVVPPEPDSHPAPPASGLVGAAVTAVGATVVAIVLGHPMFAAFAAIGAVGAVATWAVGALLAWRRRRRGRATRRRAVDELVVGLDETRRRAAAGHRGEHESIVDALRRAEEGSVWNRRVDPGDTVSFTIGPGTWRTEPVLPPGRVPDEVAAQAERARALVDVPVPWSLAAGSATAVCGSGVSVASMLRSVVVQLAVAHGPADLRLVVVTADVAAWQWATWLPHARLGGVAAIVDAADPAALRDPPRVDAVTVVVTDTPASLTQRTGDVRRFVAATGAALVVGVADGQPVPALCDRWVVIGASGCCDLHDGSVTSLDAGAVRGSVAYAGLDGRQALAAARRLAPLVDPEQVGVEASLATSVRFADVCAATTVEAITATWRAGGVDPAPRAVLGVSTDGVVGVDLVRDGPHALVAGTTGSGKSELLRTLVMSLAVAVAPEHLHLVLVDFKGGSTFDRCVDLPHTVGVLTDLDQGLAERALLGLDAEVRRREELLRSCAAEDLTAYRRAAHPPLARVVIVVDEFATLAREHPDVLASLVSIAQRGRSLGLHLVLATQRPAGVVTDDIRANTNLRLALRLHDRTEALDVVGDDAPASFGRRTPGRALLRLGPDEVVVFQAASVTGPHAPGVTGLVVESVGDDESAGDRGTELDTLVDAVRATARNAGLSPPERPWRDPLPDVLDRFAAWQLLAECDVDRGCGVAAVGVVDDPAAQRYRALRWNAGDGNLLLVGSLGSGTSSTLRALLGCVAAHVYVVDASGDGGFDDVLQRPNCGGVIRVHESERLQRLVTRLGGELDARAAGARVGAVPIVVGVDGIAALRNQLADVDRGRSAELLDRLLRDGPALGISFCLAGASPSSLLPAADRWVFHLDEPGAARALGVAPVPRVPGRLRMVSTGLEAQVVAPRDGDGVMVDVAPVDERIARLGRPAPIEVLPESVDLRDLTGRVVGPVDDPGRCADDVGRIDRSGETRLVVGISADDLEPAALHVADGDHVLVVGEPRAGVTTALDTLALAWAGRHARGEVRRIASVDDVAAALDGRGHDGDGLLLVVDDAHRLADAGGLLARLVAASDPSVTVLAGARVDRVRAAYGHWARDVARGGCGLLLPGLGDADGDLFDTVVPRRAMVPPRAGLGWLIDRTGHRLVQVAARMQR